MFDFKILRRLANYSRRFPSLRFLAVGYTSLRCILRGGGVVVLSERALFNSVFEDLGITPKKDLSAYSRELLENTDLQVCWEKAISIYNIKKYTCWQDRIDKLSGNIVLYYAMVRELKPQIIVETGTATGSMTSWLLAALEKNGQGNLISIDIPPKKGILTMDITVEESEIGYYIPESLRHRWDYRIGDAKILLPRILAEKQIDMFVHDSLHTRSHMLFEYAVARCLMRDKTIILSDDILWNQCFDSFAQLFGTRAYAPLSNPNIGCLVNRFDAFELSVGTNIIRTLTV